MRRLWQEFKELWDWPTAILVGCLIVVMVTGNAIDKAEQRVRDQRMDIMLQLQQHLLETCGPRRVEYTPRTDIAPRVPTLRTYPKLRHNLTPYQLRPPLPPPLPPPRWIMQA